MPPTPSLADQLEHAIRERGVRVEERLVLLRRLTEDDGLQRIQRERDELLDAVRRAAERVRGELA